ncbi:NAD-dependent epimerase/dehydratase family protein [Streptomyces polyrhachis]|uniref:NAD-dependent epimerase/dehydratase family protein n=1 Tax=Streptomyces polyrhachis TaxID=1282885 RepID=A0ABW2GHZ0_9ACTN
MREVCVIGGSRYFGRHLIDLLLAAGDRVTVVNRGSAPAPPGTDHVRADRDDAAALAGALGDRAFDAVIDQVCYTPAQAAVAARVFTGRAARYVMTSTMEVYAPPTSSALPPTTPGSPLREDAVDPAAWPVTGDLGDDPATRYAEGKRQAEAVLAAAALPTAFVRSAHVLGGGAQDFTGRLAHYTARIAAGEEVLVHPRPQPTVFVGHREIAEVLRWAAGADFTGPVNACSHGEWDAAALSGHIAARLGARPPRLRTARDGETPSPYSFDTYYAMDNSRAATLGFPFSRTSDWLDAAIDDAARA